MTALSILAEVRVIGPLFPYPWGALIEMMIVGALAPLIMFLYVWKTRSDETPRRKIVMLAALCIAYWLANTVMAWWFIAYEPFSENVQKSISAGFLIVWCILAFAVLKGTDDPDKRDKIRDYFSGDYEADEETGWPVDDDAEKNAAAKKKDHH